MDSSSITSLANVRLSSKSRLLRTACCPDKDLVLLISRVGNADKLSLWKIQGSKRWEVEVDSSSGNGEEVTALAWSPDGSYGRILSLIMSFSLSIDTYCAAR